MSKTDEITQLFSNIIDTINDEKLNAKKDKIMESIREDIISDKQITDQTKPHTAISQTVLLFSTIVDPIKYPKLEGKTNKIMEWITANETRIAQLDRKPFMNEISAYCDDKKLKGALGKVWKEYEVENMKHKEEQKYENEQETDMKSSEIGRTAAMTDDTELKEEPKHDEESENESDESEESTSCYAYGDRTLPVTEQMPTYIRRAIWFRSDDETLERLVDRAVKFVCKSTFWNDPEWIGNLYDAIHFEKNVESIGNNFHFFEAFVHRTFRREMLLEALRQEERPKPQDDDTEETATDNTTRYYQSKYIQHEPPEEGDTDDLLLCSEYHVYRADSVNLRHRTAASPDGIPPKEFPVKEAMDRKFKWFVWIRKKLSNINESSKGYWQVLTHEAKGVPIPHLNVLFELLRSYYHDKIKRARDFDKLVTLTRLRDVLYETYCVDHHEPHRKDVHIKLYGGSGYDTNESEPIAHYVLTWWNCKKRTDCFAITIKIHNSDREWYYMRLNVSDLEFKHDETHQRKPKPIEWQWYDNDNSKYQTFPDYYEWDKEGLLHMQMEATYQANLNSNFPWKWFDTFNNARLTHLRTVLKQKRGAAANVYLLRFTRLEYGETRTKEEEEEHKRKQKILKAKHQRQRSSMLDLDFLRHQTLHILLSMEQVAISESGAYTMNLKRLNDGTNALKAQYSGSEAYIKDWLMKYQLATESQQKYFWSFILSIATKIKLMDIEIENQLVTIPIREHVTHKHDLFSNGAEVAQEQQDALLYTGFLVPPVLGEAIVDTMQSDGNASIAVIRETRGNSMDYNFTYTSNVTE